MRPVKSYEGRADYLGGGGDVYKVVNGERQLLPLRLDLRNHSPTGFAWGYAGSGPAQLSLAILCDALGDDRRALELYQDFKAKVIAQIDGDKNFALSETRVISEAVCLESRRRALR